MEADPIAARAGGRDAEVFVDLDHALAGPAEKDSVIGQGSLSLLGFEVLANLAGEDDGRLRVGQPLLGNLTRIFVETVHAFYAERAAREGALGAKTGALMAVQRTSSDLRTRTCTWSLSIAPGTSRAASCAGKGSPTCRRARSAPCSRAPSGASSGTFAGSVNLAASAVSGETYTRGAAVGESPRAPRAA